jgi:hypothetical protein
MNDVALTALAALVGSAIGGLTSFIASRIQQTTAFKTQLLLSDKAKRQEVYASFVDQACKLYGEALTRGEPDLLRIVSLYGLISQMRIISSVEVTQAAESVTLWIIDTFSQHHMSLADIRVALKERNPDLDPLRDFSRSCREELISLLHHHKPA